MWDQVQLQIPPGDRVLAWFLTLTFLASLTWWVVVMAGAAILLEFTPDK